MMHTGEAQTPERYVIWYVWCADRAKQDRMVFLQVVQAAIWDVFAMPFVKIAAPSEVVETELKFAEDDCKLLEYLNASADDLGANTIGGDRGDSVEAPGVVDLTRRHNCDV